MLIVENPRKDIRALIFRDVMEKMKGRLESAHNRTQRRLRENAIIRAAELAGEPVAVVWSGMDCDCVRYSGSVSFISLDPESPYGLDKNGEPFKTLRAAVDHHIDHTYYWADGPCDYALMSKEQAESIQYQSRDLALEAFEDGHPHYVTY